MKRMKHLRLLLAVSSLANGATMLDRIAVVVGNHAIKTSDIDRDLRVTAFLNGEALDLGPQAKKQAADRLVDQQIIHDELQSGDYRRPSPEEVDAFVRGVIKQRFHSDEQYESALSRYGLTDAELRRALAWQLTVLKFIDARFRPAILVTDTDVESYYQQHKAELMRQYPRLTTLAALTPKIRETLQGERINQEFFSWLADQRKERHIEYMQGAFES